MQYRCVRLCVCVIFTSLKAYQKAKNTLKGTIGEMLVCLYLYIYLIITVTDAELVCHRSFSDPLLHRPTCI